MPTPHWLFGDQLGPHFLRPADGGPEHNTPVVMIEARSVHEVLRQGQRRGDAPP